jgi:hypothetical protein
MSVEPKEKDFWDKAAIVLQPVGGLLAALAVAGLGFFGSQFIERRQSEETRSRFASELISKREEADSALRKDMFVSIIQSFLRPESTSIDDRLLKLELLAYNFHESLNLKPLFIQLERDTIKSGGAKGNDLRDRLSKVAREVTRKEMVVLEEAGKAFERTVDFDDLARNPGGIPLEPVKLTLNKVERSFMLVVKKVDYRQKEMQIRLEVKTRNEDTSEFRTDDAEFWVGYYDFPMIDHVRLSHDQRFAVILKNFGGGSARIAAVMFPGSYASLKEKPYVQEMVKNLLQTNKPAEGASR